MRKNFGSKPWCYPMPVFIVATYDENGNPNAMNAAWGGIDYDDRINICMGDDHKTTQNLKVSKAFTVSMGTVDQMVVCDYVGVESALKASDKWKKTGWHAEKSEFVNAPIIRELPMTMECEMVSYDEEECHLVGRIVNISVDESVLDEEGKIDVRKLRPISYDPVKHEYLEISGKVGNAFKDGLALK
ncbi:MAG: flavin reductase family protein [Bacteroidia bacterium]|nr:flavin reductase family protein [Bacteroidia bacterium]